MSTLEISPSTSLAIEEAATAFASPFDAIPALKASSNENPSLGNETARTLFQDADYVDAHKAIAGFRGGHLRRRQSRL